MEKLLNIFNNKNVALVFISLVCAAFILESAFFEPHDFSNYYYAAEFLKTGELSESIFYPHLFNQDIADLGVQGVYTSFAPHNPFLAMCFVPFSFFPIITAKLIFGCIGLSLFIFSLNNLTKLYPLKVYILYAIPIIFFIPFRNNILFGQLYFYLFFLLVEGFIAYKKERYWRMGFLWGFAVLLKVIPIILFAILVLKKRYKASIIYGAAIVLLLSVSLLISGVDIWLFYFSEVLPKGGAGEITFELVQNYQSMFMFLKEQLIGNELGFGIANLIFKLLILIIGVHYTLKEKEELKIFSYWIFASILLSPYGSTYTAIFLLIPFVAFISKKDLNLKVIGIVLLFGLIANLPIHLFAPLAWPLSYPRLILSLILFGMLFFLTLRNTKIHFTILIIVPIILLKMFTYSERKSDGVIVNDNSDLLNYKLYESDGYLATSSWSQEGERLSVSEFEVDTYSQNGLEIKNEEVFLNGTQLTFDRSKKLDPLIVNDSVLVYLSDRKRGFGFYDIYKMNIAD